MRFKIGNLEILAERSKKPEVTELGTTGTQVFSGIITEEYNADLRGSKATTTYDKMRKSDARVKVSILVCELPLRAVTWSVDPGSDNGRDKEIAKALEYNLMNMTITWDSFLHHVLLMLPYGFSPFEKVWEIVDNQIRYRKLAPRLPKTVSKWLLDANGGLMGIEQSAYTASGSYKTIPISAEKLLVFTNEKEGSNFEGVSILRTAYKHWYYKDGFYRIDGIAAENNAIGIPEFKHPPNTPPDQKNLLDQMGQHIYAHEQNYVRIPNDHEFNIKGVSGAIKDLIPSIEHHNKAISESVLADFLNLGSGDKGSWALSKDKSSFFLMSLSAVGKNICDTFNSYAIPQWVEYNYGPVDNLPKLTHGSLETRNVKEYCDAATELLQSGGLTPDLETENALRDMLKMPPKEEADYEKPVINKPASNPSMIAEKKVFASAEINKKRDLTPSEKFVAFGEIEKKLDETEQVLISACKDLMNQQINNLADAAARVIEKRQLEKIDGIEVRYKTQMADKIYSILKDLLQYGRDQVKRELEAQKGTTLVEEKQIGLDNIALIEEFLRARSRAAANTLATKLKNSATFLVLKQIKTGVLDREELIKGLLELSDRELVATAKLSTSEAFNFGRGVAAATAEDEIDRVQYSAILDKDTCEKCEPMDGQEWDYPDPRTEKYASGNPDCLGGGRCRCILIYIYKSEVPAVV